MKFEDCYPVEIAEVEWCETRTCMRHGFCLRKTKTAPWEARFQFRLFDFVLVPAVGPHLTCV
ncbi:hypothetical protein GOODEAATRI_031893 [Goodea atripinnis]|uniref:Uncharacterized protein n=1 Tax=Goodea atripinnis TaxID=208336 RepID=A0ABV0Q382_9TELE